MPGREVLEAEGGNAAPEPCLTHPAICSPSLWLQQTPEQRGAQTCPGQLCVGMRVSGDGCSPLPFLGLPSWVGTGSFPSPGSLSKPLGAADTSVPETTTTPSLGPEPPAAVGQGQEPRAASQTRHKIHLHPQSPSPSPWQGSGMQQE